jgi:hypothetical protein
MARLLDGSEGAVAADRRHCGAFRHHGRSGLRSRRHAGTLLELLRQLAWALPNLRPAHHRAVAAALFRPPGQRSE